MRRVLPLITLLTLAALLAACGLVTPSQETTPVPERVLRLGERDWGYPSPYAFYPRGPGYVRMTFLFDTLAWMDQDDIIPWLAEAWDSSEDGKTWTVRLVTPCMRMPPVNVPP